MDHISLGVTLRPQLSSLLYVAGYCIMSNEMPGLNRKLVYVCVLYICLVLGAQGKSQYQKISGQMLYIPSIVLKQLKSTFSKRHLMQTPQLYSKWTNCFKSDQFHRVIFHDAFIKEKIHHSRLNSLFALCLL